MKGIYLIFDYFKEAFHLNRKNKGLYKPQIILIIIKSLMILSAGFVMYDFVNNLGPEFDFRYAFNDVFKILMYLAVFFTVLLVYVIIARIVEAGLYNMYKSCIVYGEIRQPDFWQGVSKYFFKFLFGDILIAFGWIICLFPYIVLGILSLTIGFTIIPMVVSIFLTMWKISMVMHDISIMESFKRSFRFAKENFYQLAVLQIINWAFTRPTAGGGYNYRTIGNGGSSGSNSTSPFDSNNIPDTFGSIPNKQEMLDTAFNIIKIGIAVIVPVITVAAAVGALVKMIFDIFFSVVLFVAYKNEFKQPSQVQEEAQTDVV